MRSAEVWVAQARAAREALERAADERRSEAEQLHERALELAPRIRDVPPPGEGIEATHEWASRGRGALLLERSNLARERDAVVREASELVASVTGEPLVTTAVAGIRRQLALALGEPPS